MGEHKIKQYNRQEYLRHNPLCCYCGAPATTTDHIPSRHYFLRRDWPEGFEFPACEPCNAETRVDEQVMAFLLNLRLINSSPAFEDLLARTARALKNNAPDILLEWNAAIPTSVTGRKRAFRNAFGPFGDELRRRGYGMIDIGPRTRESMERFTIKLGRALLFRHTGRLLDGYIFTSWHNVYIDPVDSQRDRMQRLHAFATDVMLPERADKPLIDQFFYQYKANQDPVWLFASITFSEQMMFDLTVLSETALDRVLATAGKSHTKTDYEFARQRLKFPSDAARALFPHTNFPRRLCTHSPVVAPQGDH